MLPPHQNPSYAMADRETQARLACRSRIDRLSERAYSALPVERCPRRVLVRDENSARCISRRKRRTVCKQKNSKRWVMDKLDLSSLEMQLDELIKRCETLDDENRALRGQQTNLMAERASLIEKSELARSRVEAMIARLKAMEIGS